jgi:DNA gyrase subunit B
MMSIFTSRNRRCTAWHIKTKIKYAYNEQQKDKLVKEFSVPADKLLFNGTKVWANESSKYGKPYGSEKRTLLLVSIDDAAAADRTFDIYGGEAVPLETNSSQLTRKIKKFWIFDVIYTNSFPILEK